MHCDSRKSGLHSTVPRTQDLDLETAVDNNCQWHRFVSAGLGLRLPWEDTHTRKSWVLIGVGGLSLLNSFEKTIYEHHQRIHV